VILGCVAVVLICGARPAAADLEDGLVAYFKLDETSGEVAVDASGNGNDGTLTGPTLGWIPGYDGGCLECDAPVDEEIVDELEFPTTGMSAAAGTVAVWAYLNDPQPQTSGRYIFGHTTDPRWTNRIQVYMQDGTTDSRLLDLGLGDSHALDTDIVELPMGQWLHVAVTWDNGQYAVYVDGEEVSNGTYSGLADLYPTAAFGNDGSVAPYEAFSGRLDEARVYNRAVTADEVGEIVALPAEPRIFAWAPDPPDGAVDVVTPLVQWKSLDLILLHDVYFGTDPNLGPDDLVQSRMPMKLYFHGPGLTPGQQYYWRVDEIDPDMTTVHTGDVWTFIAQPYTAYLPDPADGANDASSTDPNIDLTWAAGLNAVEHQVYFADNFADVNDGAAAADQGTFADPNFAPGQLSPLTSYYWRVDEIDMTGTVQTGEVWSFTTYSPIDDFEDYNNAVGQRPFEVWVDGIGYSLPEPGNPGNGTGAAVGHDVWSPDSPYFGGLLMETSIVNGGAQSMPVDYNNVNQPYYSQIERTWAVPQNWTVGGADSLTVHFRGEPSNGAESLYVSLQDSAGMTAVVVHDDAEVLKIARWQTWTIPYTAFEGVNAAAVKTMMIGMGDRAAPAPGGAGTVYFDDFWITKPHPTE
jgi:hypothetical protein